MQVFFPKYFFRKQYKYEEKDFNRRYSIKARHQLMGRAFSINSQEDLVNDEGFGFTIIITRYYQVVKTGLNSRWQIQCLSQAAALVVYHLFEYILASSIYYP